MNAAALSFMNLPFYTKQTTQVSTTQVAQAQLTTDSKDTSNNNNTTNSPQITQLSAQQILQLPAQYQQTYFQQQQQQQGQNGVLTSSLQTNNNQNANNFASFQSQQTDASKSNKMALNLTTSGQPASIIKLSNNTNVASDNRVNNSNVITNPSGNLQVKTENQTNNFMQTYTGSSTGNNPLIETLAQSTPAATSTPNPIQQQQQTILNQDIINNLFLKFDPANFFPKKDQLSLIASTLVASNGTNQQNSQLQQANSVIQANNLSSFNSLLNSNNNNNNNNANNSNNDKASEQSKEANNKKQILNSNMTSQQQFVKLETAGTVNQSGQQQK